MASVEEDFPRGGTAKKPTESKIVVQRTEVDNLFQVEYPRYAEKKKLYDFPQKQNYQTMYLHYLSGRCSHPLFTSFLFHTHWG